MRVSSIALCVLLLACSAWVADAAFALRRPKWHQLSHAYTFDDYCRDWGKRYDDAARPQRERLFRRRLHEALAHNAQPGVTWMRGINDFSDWTDAERARRSRTRLDAVHGPAEFTTAFVDNVSLAAPASVDYRLALSPRVLSDVKNQGLCGNCWAFSATETLESHLALATGEDVLVLSVQQITACATCPARTNPNITLCDGCDGGSVEGAWRHANSSVNGITEEWLYPFTEFFNNNATPVKCVNVTDLSVPMSAQRGWAIPTAPRAHVMGHVQIPTGNATAMVRALAQAGPVSISVSGYGWADYESGIFRVPPNTTANYSGYFWLDHSVQMVGYGYDASAAQHYWIVRNSWGQSWGEMGYIRLYRAADPADEPCSPPGVFTTQVCGTSGCLLDGQYPKVTTESFSPYIAPEYPPHHTHHPPSQRRR